MNKRFLVTAGNTREMIDRVRDWGNIFTGNTGYSIARSLAELGEVDLLTSNAAHLAEIEHHDRIRGTRFHSHADLKALLEQCVKEKSYDAVFMSAAVADYRPAGSFQVIAREKQANGDERWTVRNVQAAKVKSDYDQIAVLGERTEKLIDLFRSAWGYSGILVKFKLQVGIGRDELIAIGQASRRASGADYLVANTLEMVQGAEAGAYVLSEGGAEWVARDKLAARLAEIVR
ncbi:MAG TPA: phosphopantothenoylcysteine decarboxylase [Tepidisphaeraceae bacterium]|jgi:phosphopantothenoylcysteine synthetase/decarboxylase|nr:phosphopantothenoylcysteine decarboxylase [Tepidisphaeraceae bacterium]